jgi:multiple sugar transport system permease protein
VSKLNKGLSLKRRNALLGIGFILPTMIGLIIFYWYPLFSVFAYSLLEWNLISSSTWVGFENYSRLFSDPEFYNALLNTTTFILLYVPPSLIIGFILALALNRKIRGRIILRTAFVMPYIAMIVAVSIVWKWIYHPTFGLLNVFLKTIGLPTPAWLLDQKTVMLSIAIMGIWQMVGYNMLFYIAALQDVPKQLYEAAVLDGATSWKKHWYVTIPLISPTTFFVLIINLIGGFQVFDQIFMMTEGGPGNASTTMVYYMYNTGFNVMEIGYSSAVAVILFLILLIVTVFNFWGQKRWVHYE